MVGSFFLILVRKTHMSNHLSYPHLNGAFITFMNNLPDGWNGPTRSKGTLVVKLTPPRNASKPCQEHTCPYATPVGVEEERSVLMGFLRVIIREPIA